MAAISLSDCTIKYKQEGEFAEVVVITPATADSADTIDVTAIKAGRTVSNVLGWDVTSGDSVTATYVTATDVITIDAAGATTDHTYHVSFRLV